MKETVHWGDSQIIFVQVLIRRAGAVHICGEELVIEFGVKTAKEVDDLVRVVFK